MLDYVSVFTYGGVALWSHKPPFSLLTSDADPINALISNVLIEGREAESKEYMYGTYAVKWAMDNQNLIVVVAVLQKQLLTQLSYVDELLARLQRRFVAKYKAFLEASRSTLGPPLTASALPDFDTFTKDFNSLHTQLEAESKEKQGPKVMGGFESGVKAQKLREKAFKSAPSPTSESQATGGSDDDSGMDVDDVDARRRQFVERQRSKGKLQQKKPATPTLEGSPKAERKAKQKREWLGENKKGTTKDLDYSEATAEDKAAREAEDVQQLLAGVGDVSMAGDVRDLEYDEDEADDTDNAKPQAKGFFANLLDGITGNKIIEEKDLDAPLQKYKEHLVSKNVAENVATDLVAGLKQSLVGTKMSTLSGINSVVRDSLSKSLTRILSPNRRIDILRDVMETQRKGRPYVITFCGVNGVGKSTNLAKVAYWLLQNGFSVLIAACDTFRAGAVEQLRVHQTALRCTIDDPARLELYEKGYGKDAAAIAMEAVKFAKETHKDVVLIDTAGRMQNNEPLMRSLAKLVNINQPDLVLFVGEALVGNEAVDQLSKFNQAMVDYAMDDKPRMINGIILSKFDTIDDKVGAAISMTYTTGQPVIFVGMGQTYTDLRKLNVKTVVQSLIK